MVDRGNGTFRKWNTDDECVHRKNFNPGGAIGGTVNENLGKKE
jgi:hypothetical protein